MVAIETVTVLDGAFGASPCWDMDDAVLWWVETHAEALHIHDPETGSDQALALLEPPGAVAVREIGGLVITLASGFHFFDPVSGRLEPIVDPEPAHAGIRFGMGRTDRKGRFWAGSMTAGPAGHERSGGLFRLDLDLTCHRAFEGVGGCGGLGWSPDEATLYCTDGIAPLVHAFDCDPVSGRLSRHRVFVDLTGMGADGDVPAGLAVDVSGTVFVCVAGAGAVMRFDPAGRLMQRIATPGHRPTGCDFGGADLDILYVTVGSAASGGLLAVRGTGARGLPPVPFRG